MIIWYKIPNPKVKIKKNGNVIHFSMKVGGSIILETNCISEENDNLRIGNIHIFTPAKCLPSRHQPKMMESIIKYAKKHHYKKIIGEITERNVDEDYYDRLESFLKKYGFTVMNHAVPSRKVIKDFFLIIE